MYHQIIVVQLNFMKNKYVYTSGFIVLIIAAFFSRGYHHIDEHIQILEFAGLKLNKTVAENLPWEYHKQMRSAIQPVIVVFLSRIFNVIGIDDPFTITLFLRLLSASLGFLSMYLIYKAYYKSITDLTLKKWFLFLSFFLWFLIYNNVRFSSESWSGSIFIVAFALLHTKQSPKQRYFLYIGFLLGLSFLFRYQTGLLIAGLISWFLLVKKNAGNALFLMLGFLVAIGLGMLIDRWFYGKWTITIWNYFEQNILLNKVSGFGIKPWWFYFYDVFIRAVPPFSILYIICFILVFLFKRKDVLTWTLLPFLLIHFIIGHKETRFLFPLIGFLPIFIIKSIEIIQEKWNKAFPQNKYLKIFAKVFWVVNVVLLFVIAFKPANPEISLFQKIYSGYPEPVTIYYTEKDPYLNIYYYRRANLEIVEMDSVGRINWTDQKKILIITSDTTILKQIGDRKKLIYSTYPDWIKRFNFNQWMERTNYFRIYELY